LSGRNVRSLTLDPENYFTSTYICHTWLIPLHHARSGITKCCSCSTQSSLVRKPVAVGSVQLLCLGCTRRVWNLDTPAGGTSCWTVTVYRVHGERAADRKQIMGQARGTGCQDAMPPPRRARVPSWNREDRRKWGRRAAEARGHARPHAQRPGATTAAAWGPRASPSRALRPPSRSRRRPPPSDAAAQRRP